MNLEHKSDFICECGIIKLDLYIPFEIARCHCTICKKIHHKSPILFAKYDIDVINNIKNDIYSTTSSKNAKRFFCKKCDTPICMVYTNSRNVWIYSDMFTFDISKIDQYDICT